MDSRLIKSTGSQDYKKTPEVFAALIAVPIPEDEASLARGPKGTRTTWSGLDRDD